MEDENSSNTYWKLGYSSNKWVYPLNWNGFVDFSGLGERICEFEEQRVRRQVVSEKY